MMSQIASFYIQLTALRLNHNKAKDTISKLIGTVGFRSDLVGSNPTRKGSVSCEAEIEKDTCSNTSGFVDRLIVVRPRHCGREPLSAKQI